MRIGDERRGSTKEDARKKKTTLSCRNSSRHYPTIQCMCPLEFGVILVWMEREIQRREHMEG